MNNKQLLIAGAALLVVGSIRYLEPIRQRTVNMNACVEYRVTSLDYRSPWDLANAVQQCNGR